MATNAGTNLRDRRQNFLWLFKRRFWKDRKELDNQWWITGCGNYWSSYYSTKKVDHPPSAIFIWHFLKNTRFKNLLQAKSLIFYRKIQPYLQELQASAQTPTWAFSEIQLQHTRKKRRQYFQLNGDNVAILFEALHRAVKCILNNRKHQINSVMVWGKIRNPLEAIQGYLSKRTMPLYYWIRSFSDLPFSTRPVC